MRVLSLFSGVGAFEKALTNIGVDYELAGFSEIDKWAIESYSAIHDVDESLNLGDVSKIDEIDLPDADLITYGFPCQDISVAGKGEGIREDTRSGLLYEAERVIEHVKPKYAIAENVKNLVGKRFKRDFEELLERLEGYGYNNYWEVLNAKDFGVPQNRERVFVVSIRKDIDDEVFKFPEGKDSGVKLKDILLEETEEKYYIDNSQTKGLLSELKGQDSLKGKPSKEALNSPKDKTNHGWQVYDEQGEVRIARASRDSGNISKILEPKEQFGRMGRQGVEAYNELQPRYGDTINPFNKSISGENMSPTITTRPEGFRTAIFPIDKTHRIRKITPLECWRLMGFEDKDYWVARRRLEEKFYNGGDRSNSQMYKQAGNSIVVDVLEAIFKNLFK